MTARNSTADLLKGVAVVLMIQVHLIEQFATLDISQSAVGKFSLFLGGPPAAPIFLAVMGFFLARSQKTLAQHLGRGALLILGGITLNIGLNANLLYAIDQGLFQLDPLAFVFGADILPLAGLSVIGFALLREMFKQQSLAYLAAAFVVAIVTPFLPNLSAHSSLAYVMPFFWSDLWWSYFPLFPWLAYTLLGVWFATASAIFDAIRSLNSRAMMLLLLALCVSLALSSQFAIHTITELPLYYHHGAPLFLWNCGFLLLWFFVVAKLESSFGESAAFRYFKWLGSNVTSAYVFQWLIIGNIATELYRTQSLAQVAMWFVAITFATSLLVLLYKRLTARRLF